MKMTPALLIIGSLLVYWCSIFIMVILPVTTWNETPSDIWRPWSDEEKAGHKLYVANGCSYCHSQFVRKIDWDRGAERIAQSGDYYMQNPAILGTERTGPDLSQEGGQRSDDWHVAHFINPRNTSPLSLMPSWEFLGQAHIRQLVAYMQSEGLKDADKRVARQKYWKDRAIQAYQKGPDENMQWLHSQVPVVWRAMPNPYPATADSFSRGQKMYQNFCIGCHGSVGDGRGPAAPFLNPPPLNFTTVRRHFYENKYIGGIFYYQIMNGITGTAMPYFKKDLHSEKIWDLSNYIAVYFAGYTDATLEPKGIDASYVSPDWINPYQPPAKENKR